MIGSYYVKLSVELRNPRKGLIKIKDHDQECFRCCHIRHINPVKIHPERITEKDKELVNTLDYIGIDFPVSKNGFSNNFQKFENSNDLLLIFEGDKSHYVYIKDFDKFMFHKAKTKNKNTFAKVVYSVSSVKMY